MKNNKYVDNIIRDKYDISYGFDTLATTLKKEEDLKLKNKKH